MMERTLNQEFVNKDSSLKFTITGATMGHLFNLSEYQFLQLQVELMILTYFTRGL